MRIMKFPRDVPGTNVASFVIPWLYDGYAPPALYVR